MEDKFLLATDAARRLRCSSQNIRQLEKAGKLRATLKTIGGVRIFSEDAIRRFKAQREKQNRE